MNNLINLKNISKSFGDKCLVKHLNLLIQKGDRLGILGDNGTGKTTLVKMILGELEPDAGEIKLGTELQQVAYFDQVRETIDLDKTVFDNIAGGNDHVQIGQTSVHVMGYLQNYLFSPNRSRSPASSLSGGEFSRLMIAKLMTQPFNFLVLDEPTNDLDLETLEILESQLGDYKGTLVVISHDRRFIDNTVTSVLHLDGEGNTTEVVGGYSDWYAKFGQQAPQDNIKENINKPTHQASSDSTIRPVKLSYNEQRELDQIPEQIEDAEMRLEQLNQAATSDDFYNQSHDIVQKHFTDIAKLEGEIEILYTRWDSLTSKTS